MNSEDFVFIDSDTLTEEEWNVIADDELAAHMEELIHEQTGE